MFCTIFIYVLIFQGNINANLKFAVYRKRELNLPVISLQFVGFA